MRMTLRAAKAMRDGGIDATAALNAALEEALISLPAEMHDEVKSAVARAIAAVLSEMVNPAVRDFPRLEPDEKTWMDIARACAAKRAG